MFIGQQFLFSRVNRRPRLVNDVLFSRVNKRSRLFIEVICSFGSANFFFFFWLIIYKSHFTVYEQLYLPYGSFFPTVYLFPGIRSNLVFSPNFSSLFQWRCLEG